MYKYLGLVIFLLVLVMAGISVYKAITTANAMYIILSIVLVLAVIMQLRKMIHITVTYEDEDEKKK